MVGSTGLTDRTLVARCRAGDDDAWNELVSRFSRYVYAICVQGFRFSPQDAEDVFQDVFAKVYEQLGRLRDDSSVRPWIAQLTRRTCIDRLRSARETAAEEVEPPGVDDRLAELADARAESYRTIGEALDLPAGTIASRISRCLEKLKAAMEDSDTAPRPVDG